MLNWFHRVWAAILGRNTASTSTDVILSQMAEPRPLPIGVSEFLEWSDRIISGAMLPADHEDQRYALAGTIMHLGPTEDHKPDAYFIHMLRKAAVNQVAHAFMQTHLTEKKARLAAAEEAAKAVN